MNDFKFELNDFILNKTQTFNVKIDCEEGEEEGINLMVEIIPTGVPYNLPIPYLDSNLFKLNQFVTKIPFKSDQQQYEFSKIYKIGYKFQTLNNQDFSDIFQFNTI